VRSLRRALPLVCLCGFGLLFGASYLGQAPTQESAAQRGSMEGEVSRMVQTRQSLTHSVEHGAREIAYALEGAKDELAGLIP
jgi:hypothetical protein